MIGQEMWFGERCQYQPQARSGQQIQLKGIALWRLGQEESPDVAGRGQQALHLMQMTHGEGLTLPNPFPVGGILTGTS